ncbi:L-seryl-tRNA(Sec) selenium transferase (modular protein) [Frankia canadensis]|uniref:L-seryl-tRNA(Sec) selenium transferase n=1 Tax=Frankia canadensis TaxID=1836972 RepID=A0A2I2KWE9_9ACTN|nr:L-seryl-tRNA(Sec) selenium transferase [Frankia canadensis]SNQ50013.1 L-seryl-tRNA(Sec) selenium transferase (modular protein) [Frankia canadensis]SOU57303.1 L-seryl-tRNA(Sec) selenium transferase (modular protein) [Frankia canadensis]
MIDDLAPPRSDAAEDPVPAPVALARTVTGLRPVINATGVLLHGALGRAPLSAAARAAVDLAAGTTDLELDLHTGRRDRRGRTAHAAMAAAVPAAAAVHVVNNNAAALALSAAALAGQREIVVSRGELLETTDGFRLPDLLVAAGARLREVGTTNHTTLGDYADAIGPETGFVLRVHPAGYQVVGFTDRPGVGDLAALCADFAVPLVGDCGSGLLRPEPLLAAEPDVTTWLDAGVGVVTASGDKLLGGPQCGLLFGRADLIDRMRRHPMSRALRAGKLTLAALEATLRQGDSPTGRALRAHPERLTARAETLAAWLRRAGIAASAVAGRAFVDDGAAAAAVPAGAETGYRRWPVTIGAELPSAAVALDAAVAAPLRHGEPAVLGRVEHGCCLLDLRTVPPELDPVLAAAVLAAATAAGATGHTDPPTAPRGTTTTRVLAPHPSAAHRAVSTPPSGPSHAPEPPGTTPRPSTTRPDAPPTHMEQPPGRPGPASHPSARHLPPQHPPGAAPSSRPAHTCAPEGGVLAAVATLDGPPASTARAALTATDDTTSCPLLGPLPPASTAPLETAEMDTVESATIPPPSTSGRHTP